eukprot:392630-Rhodomonas_salina.1
MVERKGRRKERKRESRQDSSEIQRAADAVEREEMMFCWSMETMEISQQGPLCARIESKAVACLGFRSVNFDPA